MTLIPPEDPLNYTYRIYTPQSNVWSNQWQAIAELFNSLSDTDKTKTTVVAYEYANCPHKPKYAYADRFIIYGEDIMLPALDINYVYVLCGENDTWDNVYKFIDLNSALSVAKKYPRVKLIGEFITHWPNWELVEIEI